VNTCNHRRTGDGSRCWDGGVRVVRILGHEFGDQSAQVGERLINISTENRDWKEGRNLRCAEVEGGRRDNSQHKMQRNPPHRDEPNCIAR
jgi:hypothetical protein